MFGRNGFFGHITYFGLNRQMYSIVEKGPQFQDISWKILDCIPWQGIQFKWNLFLFYIYCLLETEHFHFVAICFSFPYKPIFNQCELKNIVPKKLIFAQQNLSRLKSKAKKTGFYSSFHWAISRRENIVHFDKDVE